MNRSFLKGAAVGVVCALLGGATVALAGSGVGGVFNLGVSNSVDAKTALTGSYGETQLEVTNTGGANGVQGVSNGGGAAGVYGENDGGGYGVAGTSLNPDGVGVSGYGQAFGVSGRSDAQGGFGVYGNGTASGGVGVNGTALGGGDAHGVGALSNGTGGAMIANNIGGGPALELHSSGAPITVDSSVKVNNLNADKVDGLDSTQLVIGDPGRGGGRLIAGRRTAAVPGSLLLFIPGMGRLVVHKCDGTVGQVEFNTAGTGPVDIMYEGLASNSLGSYAPGDNFESITNSDLFPTNSGNFGATLLGAYTINIARNTLQSTQIATIWLSWYAPGCRFQAQALVSPQP
jgi:hypothetical protein